MMQPVGGEVPTSMMSAANQQYHHPQPPPPQQWMMPQQPMQQHPQAPPAAWSQQPAQQPGAYSQAQPVGADEIRTLWIGDLQYWMEESYLQGCFAQSGEFLSVKVIRNKQTGQSEGYGFVEFASRAAAERALQTYNGTQMPNGEQNFRLNWASHSAGERRDDGSDYPIFVGDLASDVTDYMLQETFRGHYPSVKGAKIVIDRITGRSKGYGFVRFGDETEQLRAMSEMNGMMCLTRPMRIGPAANKKIVGSQQQISTKGCSEGLFLLKGPGTDFRCEMHSLLVRGLIYQNDQGNPSENDPNNTTIFVGGLDNNVTEEHLRQLFSSYGELVHIKIPVGKRCGFVQFANRNNAEEALLMLNGAQLGGQSIRLSWGRSPNKQESSASWVQPQPDPSQWNNAYYGGYGQGYDAPYGYAAPSQDPNMYAYGGYPAYNNYQQQ